MSPLSPPACRHVPALPVYAVSATDRIKHAALRLGFHAVGIARVSPGASAGDVSPGDRSLDDRLARLGRWLAQGYHGTMEWMARHPRRRADPAEVLTNCRSVIAVGMNYWTDVAPDERRGRGRIARYARGRDYHRVFGNKLKRLEREIRNCVPDCHTRRYADTGPVMEKFWAQRAGLGWIGKHSNLVSPAFGSWLLLGEILTTAELEADEPGADLCGTCTLCIRACPTGAIVEPYVVDARQCIAYLTIEYRGDRQGIARDLQAQTGNRVFGCDDCLDACPYNAEAPVTDEAAFYPRGPARNPDLSRLASLSEREFARCFEGSPVRRAKFSGFQRNVAIALANETPSRPPARAPGAGRGGTDRWRA